MSTAKISEVYTLAAKGGQLMINYWYPGSPSGASVAATSRCVNVGAWAKWYLYLGY